MPSALPPFRLSADQQTWRTDLSVSLPTPDQLRAVATQCGLSLTDADVTSYLGLMQGSVDAYNLVGSMPDEVPLVKYPRTPGP